MENKFKKWYNENEQRFSDGQMNEKEIAYSAWLEAQSNEIGAPVRCTINGYFLDEKEPEKGETVLVYGFRREQFVDGVGDFNTRVSGECRYCGNGKFIRGTNIEVRVTKWAPMPIIY